MTQVRHVVKLFCLWATRAAFGTQFGSLIFEFVVGSPRFVGQVRYEPSRALRIKGPANTGSRCRGSCPKSSYIGSLCVTSCSRRWTSIVPTHQGGFCSSNHSFLMWNNIIPAMQVSPAASVVNRALPYRFISKTPHRNVGNGIHARQLPMSFSSCGFSPIECVTRES